MSTTLHTLCKYAWPGHLGCDSIRPAAAQLLQVTATLGLTGDAKASVYAHTHEPAAFGQAATYPGPCTASPEGPVSEERSSEPAPLELPNSARTGWIWSRLRGVRVGGALGCDPPPRLQLRGSVTRLGRYK